MVAVVVVVGVGVGVGVVVGVVVAVAVAVAVAVVVAVADAVAVGVGVAVAVPVVVVVSNRERRKGLRGEAEVAAIFLAHRIGIQPLGGRSDQADNLTFLGLDGTTLAVEVKRQNRLRTAWIEQAEREAPAGAVPVVAWRPDGGKWWGMIPLEDLARLLA